MPLAHLWGGLGLSVATFAEGKQAPAGMSTLEMDTEKTKKVKCVRVESISRASPRLLGRASGGCLGKNL